MLRAQKQHENLHPTKCYEIQMSCSNPADRQMNQPTNRGRNITSLAELQQVCSMVYALCYSAEIIENGVDAFKA